MDPISALRLISLFGGIDKGGVHANDSQPQYNGPVDENVQVPIEGAEPHIDENVQVPIEPEPEPPIDETVQVPTSPYDEEVTVEREQPNPYEGSEGPIHSGLPKEGNDTYSRIKELYGPQEHRFSDRLYQMLDSMPTREKPSIWRRLLGGAVAGTTGDTDLGANVVDGAYRQKLADWKLGVDAAKTGATVENKNTDDARALALGMMTRETANSRLGISQDAQTLREEKFEQAKKEHEDLVKHRDRVYQLQKQALDNPNYKFLTSEDGEVVAFDTKSKEYYRTGVKAELLTWEEKQRIKLQGQIDLINERDRVHDQNELTDKDKSSSKADLDTQIKVRKYNRAQEYVRAHVKELGDYFTPGAPGTNDFEMDPPSSGAWYSRGPSKKDYDAFVAYVDAPDAGSKTTTSSKTSTVKTSSTAPAKSSLGQPPATIWVKRLSDGGELKIPFASKDRYIDSKKYVQIVGPSGKVDK